MTDNEAPAARRRGPSLARQLIVTVVIGGGLALGALFVTLDLAIDRELHSRFDAALEARGRALAGIIAARTRPPVTDDAHWPEYSAGGHQEFYQLWDARGQTLARSASSAGRDLDRPPPGAVATPLIYDLSLPDGHRGRAVALRVWRGGAPEDDDAALLLVVATEREALEALEDQLHFSLTGAALAALIVLAVLGLVAVRRTLAPLSAFSRAIAERVSTRAHTATPGAGIDAPPAADLPLELQPIARTLNEAVDTALAALEREQRFARDAAHELRTPLAELRMIAQSETPNGRDAGAVLRAVDGMTRSVDALLALARCEAGLEQPAIEPLELVGLLDGQRHLLASACDARGSRIEVALPAELWVMSDRAMLERIVANLLANAVDHAPRASTLLLAAEVSAATAQVTVSNPAPDADLAALQGAVDGERHGSAGARHGAHAGLGLALAGALAQQLGVTLAFTRRGEVVEVTLSGLALLDPTH